MAAAGETFADQGHQGISGRRAESEQGADQQVREGDHRPRRAHQQNRTGQGADQRHQSGACQRFAEEQRRSHCDQHRCSAQRGQSGDRHAHIADRSEVEDLEQGDHNTDHQHARVGRGRNLKDPPADNPPAQQGPSRKRLQGKLPARDAADFDHRPDLAKADAVLQDFRLKTDLQAFLPESFRQIEGFKRFSFCFAFTRATHRPEAALERQIGDGAGNRDGAGGIAQNHCAWMVRTAMCRAAATQTDKQKEDCQEKK